MILSNSHQPMGEARHVRASNPRLSIKVIMSDFTDKFELIAFLSRPRTSKCSSKSKHSSRSKSKSSSASAKAHETAISVSELQSILPSSHMSPETFMQQSQHPSWQEENTPKPLTPYISGPTRSPQLRHSSGQHSAGPVSPVADSTPAKQSQQPLQGHETPEPLRYYLDDPTHSNAGYSVAYTNSLVYTYGFPDQPSARSELEDEIVDEAESRARRSIDEYAFRSTESGTSSVAKGTGRIGE